MQITWAWYGKCVFWEWLEVLWSNSFLGGSTTGDDIVAWLPTLSAGFLEVEWAHNVHMSILAAVGAVRMVINR